MRECSQRNVLVGRSVFAGGRLTARLLEAWTAPECSITDVRILFVLGADPADLYVDSEGERLLNEREEAGSICGQCAPKYREFLQFARQLYDAQFNSTPIPLSRKRTPEERRKKLIALSLDGGGMRGLVSITCLLFASRRPAGRRVADGVRRLVHWEMKDEIFLDKSTMRRLLGKVVDKQTVRVNAVLDRVFGDPKDTFLQCPQRLSVPALDIATTPGKLVVFRNYPIRGKKNIEDIKFRDAARASSAAPTYFAPHPLGDSQFVDGFACCQLPTFRLEYDKSIQIGSDVQLGLVLSIGTGEPAESKRRYQSGSTIGGRSRHLADLAVLLMEQVVGHEKSVIQSAEDRCAASGIPFTRICPQGINVRIDQINDGKLIDMVWSSLLWLLSVSPPFFPSVP
ncbi:85/88 kDa calcium-independent phospholipase A2 [Aphelenchoides fujianensis]|nr:85/88 kDa calcium-independent phospholipase A2 [Aphelenchoides fujianensis]